MMRLLADELLADELLADELLADELLADENVPLASVSMLREVGHDVAYVGEEHSGLDDLAVLRMAVEEQRILLTFDTDFRTLAFLKRANCPQGIVLLRFRPKTPSEAGELIASLLSVDTVDLKGHFTVLDRDRVRQRPLPGEDK